MKAGIRRLQGAWEVVVGVLLMRLARGEAIVTRQDLAALPMDRVLLATESEDGEALALIFCTPEAAQEIKQVRGADVTTLQSMYQKLAAVLLWKYAKDGTVITQADRRALPVDRVLLVHGHADDLELRYVPLEEARAVARRERDNEGRIILPGLEPK